MKLDKLTQQVLLDRGQAHLVHLALHEVHHELLHRDLNSTKWTALEGLSFTPITTLLFQVLKLANRDDRPAPKKARPHKLTVCYPEMITLRCFYARLLATEPDPDRQPQLATALARFYQPSLNLSNRIRLPPPTGPGCQTTLL